MSNDEITVFCNGDSVISFVARGGVGFVSLQPASANKDRMIKVLLIGAV